MTLISICDVIDRIDTEHPYTAVSLMQVCETLGERLAGLHSDDLRYGLIGVESDINQWNGALSEYLVPTAWMNRLGMGCTRYTLAEACFFLQQIADVVRARELPGS